MVFLIAKRLPLNPIISTLFCPLQKSLIFSPTMKVWVFQKNLKQIWRLPQGVEMPTRSVSKQNTELGKLLECMLKGVGLDFDF